MSVSAWATTPRTVAVDFDGTLHSYDGGWKGIIPSDDPPTPGALEAMRALKVKGYKVVIFSVRASVPEGVKGIQDWVAKYGLAPFIDGITSEKPHAVAYIDDRGVPFTGNWFAALRAVYALDAKEQANKEDP